MKIHTTPSSLVLLFSLLIVMASLPNVSHAYVTVPRLTERTMVHSMSRNTKLSLSSSRISSSSSSSSNDTSQCHSDSAADIHRREILQRGISFASLIPVLTLGPPRASAGSVTPTTSTSGNLPDLPPEASRSYLQYRVPLQIAADFYIFDLQNKLSDVDSWGEINQLFQTNNNNGQGQPNKIERDFTNPMRILGLSMPPDEADAMRDAQFKFERAMQVISRSVQGIRRDLPVEIDPTLVKSAERGWEEGRLALNEFFGILNDVTGLNEMKPIPARGVDQVEQYGRSARKYNELVKKTKLCQNRGGPALSQAWGYLQTTQLLQDSCGIPDLDEYFYQ